MGDVAPAALRAGPGTPGLTGFSGARERGDRCQRPIGGDIGENGTSPGGKGAVGAALSAMVARLTLGKKKYREVSEQMTALLGAAESLRETLTRRIDEDAAAFDGVMAARGLPRITEVPGST